MPRLCRAALDEDGRSSAMVIAPSVPPSPAHLTYVTAPSEDPVAAPTRVPTPAVAAPVPVPVHSFVSYIVALPHPSCARTVRVERSLAACFSHNIADIIYKGYKKFSRVCLSKMGVSRQGVLLRCDLIKPLEENATPGSLKALHVSLVQPGLTLEWHGACSRACTNTYHGTSPGQDGAGEPIT
jgi:hypothetical protein